MTTELRQALELIEVECTVSHRDVRHCSLCGYGQERLYGQPQAIVHRDGCPIRVVREAIQCFEASSDAPVSNREALIALHSEIVGALKTAQISTVSRDSHLIVQHQQYLSP